MNNYLGLKNIRIAYFGGTVAVNKFLKKKDGKILDIQTWENDIIVVYQDDDTV